MKKKIGIHFFACFSEHCAWSGTKKCYGHLLLNCHCWTFVADCWNQLEIVEMLSKIVKKQMEIVEKNKYCWNFNSLLKWYDRLVKNQWKKM